jgi:4-hydroxymandelate oxidase
MRLGGRWPRAEPGLSPRGDSFLCLELSSNARDILRYVCELCNAYGYDGAVGDMANGIRPGSRPNDLPDSWHCPSCGRTKEYMREATDEEHSKMNEPGRPNPIMEVRRDINSFRERARGMLTGVCGEFNVCDGSKGRTCQGQRFGAPIGLGGAGQGATFQANCLALQRYQFKARLVKPHQEPDTSLTLLGRRIRAPVLGASMAGVRNSLNGAVPEEEFFQGLVQGAKDFGTIGMLGNTVDVPDELSIDIIRRNGGWGIPVFKPHAQTRLVELFGLAEKGGAIGVGVDLDGCGSIAFSRAGRPVFRKSESELRELADCVEIPVMMKGVMSLEDAAAVVDCGAEIMCVSNHGGRVLDSGQGVAEVLPQIAERHKDRITILADGCVRTGYDVLKVLALGADAALIGRPIARMAIAGGAEAVRLYYEYVLGDLRLAMIMTGCDDLEQVGPSILTHT